MDKKKLLEDFQDQLASKWREAYGPNLNVHDIGQKFSSGNRTAELRAKLVQEEAGELAKALMTEGKLDVMKECADLLYVTYALAAIYDFDIDEVFDRVHQNNMAKVTDGHFNKHGKLEKPEGLTKVDLTGLG